MDVFSAEDKTTIMSIFRSIIIIILCILDILQRMGLSLLQRLRIYKLPGEGEKLCECCGQWKEDCKTVLVITSIVQKNIADENTSETYTLPKFYFKQTVCRSCVFVRKSNKQGRINKGRPLPPRFPHTLKRFPENEDGVRQ